MYSTMSLEVLEHQREERLREAEMNCLKMALRANRKGLATSGWTTAVAWELARAVGLLRKFSQAPKNTD